MPFSGVRKFILQIYSTLRVFCSEPDREPHRARTNLFPHLVRGAKRCHGGILSSLFLHEEFVQVLTPCKRPLFEIKLTRIWVIDYPNIMNLLIGKQIFHKMLTRQWVVEFRALLLIKFIELCLWGILDTQMRIWGLVQVCIVVIIEFDDQSPAWKPFVTKATAWSYMGIS